MPTNPLAAMIARDPRMAWIVYALKLNLATVSAKNSTVLLVVMSVFQAYSCMQEG